LFKHFESLFKQVGNRGYVRGLSYLIGLHSEEKGVKRDESEVSRLVELVKRSADGGDAVGQYLLWVDVC
jgi:hypothetical protein